MLVEELQRSVIFFTRANSQLKSKNEGLEQLLLSAKQQIEVRGGGNAAAAPQQQQQQPPQKQMTPSPSMPVNVALQQAPTRKDDANLDRKPAALPQPQPTQQSDVPVVAPVAAPVQQPQPQSQAPIPTPQVQQQQTLEMANWIAMAQAAQQVSAAVEQQAGGVVPNPILSGLAMANMFANPQLMNMAAAGFMAAGFLGGQQLQQQQQNQDQATSQAFPTLQQQQVPQLQPQQFDQAGQILPEHLVTADTSSDKNDASNSLSPPFPAPCPADTGTAEI